MNHSIVSITICLILIFLVIYSLVLSISSSFPCIFSSSFLKNRKGKEKQAVGEISLGRKVFYIYSKLRVVNTS
jgi:hypothetical protein